MGKPAATISSYHMCPNKTAKKPHVGGPIVAGAATVTVNGKGIARLGDATVHGGKIMEGNPTVLVG